MSYVFVAGTFNVFHDGHKRLLDKALEVQRENDGSAIIVGVTTDEYARTHKDVPVDNLWIRGLRVDVYLRSKGYPFGLIWPIDGPGIPPDFPTSRDDVLICASDTKDNAMDALAAIPEERRPRMVVIWRDPAMPSSSDMIRSMSTGNE